MGELLINIMGWSMNTQWKLEELEKLYKKIQNCHECPRMDKDKTLRLLDGIDPNSDVFIISQALAADQLRKSGVSFFEKKGKLGKLSYPTGENLENFLNKFNRTLYPPKEKVGDMIIQCHDSKRGYKRVYCSEIVQCYPGKNKVNKEDRRPSEEEIEHCINKGFLIDEIKIIKPKLILLMGKVSRDSFFKYILHIPESEYPSSLSEHISKIIHDGKIPEFPLDNLSFYVLPIQHASGANPSFYKMMNDDKLIKLIKKVLRVTILRKYTKLV
jgi:uracil-DNA glycosylase family 4